MSKPPSCSCNGTVCTAFLRLVPQPQPSASIFLLIWPGEGCRRSRTALSSQTRARATAATRTTMTQAKADLGDAQAPDPLSRRHLSPTALVRSDTDACCPGASRASQRAGPPSRPRKRPPGRRSGCRPQPAPNFARSPLLRPVSLSPVLHCPLYASQRTILLSSLRLKSPSLTHLLSDPRATKAMLRFLTDSGRFDSLYSPPSEDPSS